MTREPGHVQVRCPHCKKLYDQDEIEGHIASEHPEKT